MFSCLRGTPRSARRHRRRNRRNRPSLPPPTDASFPALSEPQLDLHVSDVTHESGSHLADPTPPSAPTRRVVSTLVDCSFSMLPMWDALRASYSEFLDRQKQLPGDAVYSLRLFDTMQHEVYRFASAQDAGPIPRGIHPRGGTALIDSVVMEIGRINKFVLRNQDFDHVTLVVLTDSVENMSVKHCGVTFETIVRVCEKRGWQVVLGVTNEVMEIATRAEVQGVIHVDIGQLPSAYEYVRDMDTSERKEPLHDDIMDISTACCSESMEGMSEL